MNIHNQYILLAVPASVPPLFSAYFSDSLSRSFFQRFCLLSIDRDPRLAQWTLMASESESTTTTTTNHQQPPTTTNNHQQPPTTNNNTPTTNNNQQPPQPQQHTNNHNHHNNHHNNHHHHHFRSHVGSSDRMTVAMGLATTLHQSAQRVEVPREEAGREQHCASQGPKPLPQGTWPGASGVARGTSVPAWRSRPRWSCRRCCPRVMVSTLWLSPSSCLRPWRRRSRKRRGRGGRRRGWPSRQKLSSIGCLGGGTGRRKEKRSFLEVARALCRLQPIFIVIEAVLPLSSPRYVCTQQRAVRCFLRSVCTQLRTERSSTMAFLPCSQQRAERCLAVTSLPFGTAHFFRSPSWWRCCRLLASSPCARSNVPCVPGHGAQHSKWPRLLGWTVWLLLGFLHYRFIFNVDPGAGNLVSLEANNSSFCDLRTLVSMAS